MVQVPFDARWHPRPLVALNLLALLLLASWLWPTTRIFWDALDHQVFLFLNQPLGSSSSWAMFWALASVRVSDALVGLVMLLFFLRAGLVFEPQRMRSGLFGFLILLAALLVFRVIFAFFCNHLGWQHASASLVEPDAVRLSALFPELKAVGLKDAAGHSFPGDHASIVWLWAFYLSFFARGWWRRILIWALAVLFMLPRLVAGAHWMSDDLVGGLFLCLVILGWCCYSPFLSRTEPAFRRWVDPMVDWIGRMPVLNRASFFSRA